MLATISEFKKMASEGRFHLFRLCEVGNGFQVTGYIDRLPALFELQDPNRSPKALTLRITRPTDFNGRQQRSFSSLDKAFAFVKALTDSVPVVIVPQDCTDATCHRKPLPFDSESAVSCTRP